jgi:hypothetical protein
MIVMANPEPDPQERLPERLEEALRQLASKRVPIPRERDEKVLISCREQLWGKFGRARRQQRLIWAAAALVVAGFFAWSLIHRGGNGLRDRGTAEFVGNAADLDGNGRVDIFDAFVLARGIRDGRTGTTWDINRDAVVDANDVSAIAQLAVRTGTQPKQKIEGASFRVIDIFLDPKGKSLGAYQLGWKVTTQNARIVGIEGGDHPAFRNPPQYDPRAIQGERLVVAAFNAGAEKSLPRGRIRIGSIHIEAAPSAICRFEIENLEAADVQGRRISVTAQSAERRKR